MLCVENLVGMKERRNFCQRNGTIRRIQMLRICRRSFAPTCRVNPCMRNVRNEFSANSRGTMTCIELLLPMLSSSIPLLSLIASLTSMGVATVAGAAGANDDDDDDGVGANDMSFSRDNDRFLPFSS